MKKLLPTLMLAGAVHAFAQTTTWYSFSSGSWDQANNWTLDASGTTRQNPGGQFPQALDNVVILNGDEIDVNAILSLTSLTIEAGGVLNIGATTGHNLGQVSGQGTVRLASDNLPAGDWTAFRSAAGGTVRFEGGGYALATARTFHHMAVSQTGGADQAIVLQADYTLSGNLTVLAGYLQINDSLSDGYTDNTTPLNILIGGDLTVNSGGYLTTGNVDAATELLDYDDGESGIFTFHQLEVQGDLVNNGSLSFTNLTQTSIDDSRYRFKYATDDDDDNTVLSGSVSGGAIPPAEFGVVEVLLTNTRADQRLICNGPSRFYRIEIDKGSFTAEFTAADTAYFRLLGRIALATSYHPDDAPNIENHTALGLEGGILKLADNIIIDQMQLEDPNKPVPFTQTSKFCTRTYKVDTDAELWLAGNAVVRRLPAENTDDYPNAHSNGMQPLGKFKVSDNARYEGGTSSFVFDDKSILEIQGGTVYSKSVQTKSSSFSPEPLRGSYIHTGGTLIIRSEIGSTSASGAAFDIGWALQAFTLSASDPADPPVVNVYLEDDLIPKDTAIVQIGVKEGNYTIGPSEFNIIHSSSYNYVLNSTVPFYNLTIKETGTGKLIVRNVRDTKKRSPDNPNADLPDRETGGSTSSPLPASPAMFAQPLVVLNNLTIEAGTLDMNGQDLTVGNRLVIHDGGRYDPGDDGVTILSGLSSDQQISLSGTAPVRNESSGADGFNTLRLEGQGNTVAFRTDGNNTVTILNELITDTGVTLYDGGQDIIVNGDLSHSGTHTTDPTDPGRLVLSGGTATHTIGGTGTGVFNVLTLDDANGATLTAHQTIDSVLHLRAGILDLGSYRLTVGSKAAGPIVTDLADAADPAAVGDLDNFNSTLMIRTGGQPSDGGISYTLSDSRTALYPLGTGTAYTPAAATLTLSGGTSGAVQLNPVSQALATLADPTDDQLDYYWRVRKADFATDPDATLTLRYDDSDIQGTETGYVPGYVDAGATRTEDTGGSVDTGANSVVFSTFALTEGDFTAGLAANFAGAATKYYARQNGVWHDTDTWTTDGPTGGSPATALPGAGDLVVIGYNNTGGTGANYQVAITGVRADGSTAVSGYADINVAGVVLLSDGTGEASTLVIDADAGANHHLGKMTIDDPDNPGTSSDQPGRIAFLSDNIPGGDLAEFLDAPNTTVIYSREFPGTATQIPDDGGTNYPAQGSGRTVDGYTLPATFTSYPNLEFNRSRADSGSPNLVTFPAADIVINGDLRFVNTSNLALLSNTASAGDVTVKGNVTFADGSAQLLFPAFTSGSGGHTLDIRGDLDFNNNDEDPMKLRCQGSNSAIALTNHRLRLGGGIVNPGANAQIDLFNADANDTVAVDLEFYGSGTVAVELDTMDLYTLTVDKAGGPSDTVVFRAYFTLAAPADEEAKPVRLVSGTLALDHSDLDLDLNTGGGDFEIPATAGLDVRDGAVRITASGTGSGNGLRLDGKLSVTGGDVLLGSDGSSGNNYIEYGSGGHAAVYMTAGNLMVGSQFRRSPFSSGGTIDYNQTGGTAVFGVNTAPEDGRGVFEVFGGESTFTLGANATFALVRSSNDPLIGTLVIQNNPAGNAHLHPSLLFDPAAAIDFGYDGIVAGITVQHPDAVVYEINTTVAIPNLRVNRLNRTGITTQPVLEIIDRPLTVSGDLEILNGATLQTNSFDLTVGGDFTNDGTYTPGTNITTFDGAAEQRLGGDGWTGSGDFNDLAVAPGSTVNIDEIISVENLVIGSGATLGDGDDDGQDVVLDVLLDGSLELSGSIGCNLDLQGTSPQTVRLPAGAADIERLTLSNPAGVTLSENGGGAKVTLTVTDRLNVFAVFDIGNNLLVIDEDATAVSPGNNAGYVSLNGSPGSAGMTKRISAAEAAGLSFTYPLGSEGAYAPVTLAITSAIEYTANGVAVNVNPVGKLHPSADPTLNPPTDQTDALSYYWQVTTASLDGATTPYNSTDLIGSIAFVYDDSSLGTGANEVAWTTPARLLTDAWITPASGTTFDAGTNTFSFDQSALSEDEDGGTFADYAFDGEYSIGNDLPATLPQYISNLGGSAGSWGTAASWIEDTNGNGVIDGGETTTGVPTSGATVIVAAGDTVQMADPADNDQDLTGVSIFGTLDIGMSSGHGFGVISGDGTLVIASDQIPGGDSEAFFHLDTGGILQVEGPRLPAGFTEVRGLTLAGSVATTLPAGDFTIGDRGLTIDNTSTLDNTANNSAIAVAGDVTLTDGSFLLGTGSLTAGSLTLTSGSFTAIGGDLDLADDLVTGTGTTFSAGSGQVNVGGDLSLADGSFVHGSGTVVLDGADTAPQDIAGTSRSNPFFNLVVAGAEGLTVSADTVKVANILTLQGGPVSVSGSGALRLSKGVGSLVRSSGYVEGPLQVALEANDRFAFPVADKDTLRSIEIVVGASSADLVWQAQAFAASASGFSSSENAIPSDKFRDVEDPRPEGVDSVVSINKGMHWVVTTFEADGTTSGAGGTCQEIKVDLSHQGATEDNIRNDEVQVMVWENGAQEWDYLGGICAGSPEAATVKTSDISEVTFTERVFTSASESGDSSAPLPVSLLSFSGEADGDRVFLRWATASEQQNDYFEVQRATDGVDFSPVGRMSGHGNSDRVLNYIFIDPQPVRGVNYYRLAQYDFDGATEVHQTIRVKVSEQDEGPFISVFPNPAADYAEVVMSAAYSAASRVRMFNPEGKVVLDEPVAAGFRVRKRMDLSDLDPGVYLVEVKQEEQVYNMRLIKRK